MTARVYLTIDDSPSSATLALTEYLAARDIPALMFCRGDRLAHNMDAIVSAIRLGFVMGNHSNAHRPTGNLTFEEWVDDFEECERLLNDAYRRAGVMRPGKFYRFPYIDRGDGDRVERRFPALLAQVAAGHDVVWTLSPDVRKIQDYLRVKGCVQPFQNVRHPLYTIPEIRDAADCLFTYSTCDWMLTARHLDNPDWPHKDVDSLCRAMDADAFLNDPAGTNIVLIHDQDELLPVAIALIDHMRARKFIFERISE
jgi:peptidoglycan/xylan/chitin deacetylase (PgdA/CDA1 family)